MIEPEIAFVDLNGILNLTENLLKHIIKVIIKNNFSELEYLEKCHEEKLISKLQKIASEDFVKVNYSKCIKILAEAKENFVFNDIK